MTGGQNINLCVRMHSVHRQIKDINILYLGQNRIPFLCKKHQKEYILRKGEAGDERSLGFMIFVGFVCK